jgi:hypothetical protein
MGVPDRLMSVGDIVERMGGLGNDGDGAEAGADDCGDAV